MKLKLHGQKLIHHLDRLNQWRDAVDGQGHYRPGHKPVVPMHFDFGPTAACNYNCVHCYVRELHEAATYIDPDIYRHLMVEMPRHGVKSIFLAGRGEPLMHKSTPDMIPLGVENGLDIGLLTNGLLLTPAVSDKVLEPLTFIRFNMLSTDAAHYGRLMGTPEGNLARMRENLVYAAERKARLGADTAIGIYACIFPENAFDLFEMAAWAKNSGADYFVLKPAGQLIDGTFRFARELHIQFSEELEKIRALDDDTFTIEIRGEMFDLATATAREYDRCYGIDFLGIIDADGNVGACNGFWKVPEAQYGNLYETPFGDIWGSAGHHAARNHILDEVNCHNCYMCRQHQANRFLWELLNPPAHVTFI